MHILIMDIKHNAFFTFRESNSTMVEDADIYHERRIWFPNSNKQEEESCLDYFESYDRFTNGLCKIPK